MVNTFTYTALGQLASASMGTGLYADYTWGLDGNLVSRTWASNSASNPTSSALVASYSYDGAKRPIGISLVRRNAAADSISRTYDRLGNVTAETQTFAGVTGAGTIALAGAGTQSFTYDAANRVTGSSLTVGSTNEIRYYTYDPDSNRTRATENGVSFFYFYDATDALAVKSPTNVRTDPGATASRTTTWATYSPAPRRGPMRA